MHAEQLYSILIIRRNVFSILERFLKNHEPLKTGVFADGNYSILLSIAVIIKFCNLFVILNNNTISQFNLFYSFWIK